MLSGKETYDETAVDSLRQSDKKVYELVSRKRQGSSASKQYHTGLFNALHRSDEQVYDLITREHERLRDTLQLIAAENRCSKAVLAALGSIVQNKTTEGFAGARYHGGCEYVDELEKLAIDRAKEAFHAQYANVQPHSGTQANQIVTSALLEREDIILSLGMDQGGHVSHGAKVSFTGKFFQAENYYVDRTSFLLDYDAIRKRAIEVRPKLIICGTSAYSRTIDFEEFREIANEVGAYLLADVSHISGLIIAGAHSSCVDYAHFTTTSTYKPGGPRGGLILMGKDYKKEINVSGKLMPLWKLVQKMTFPGVQGTPYLNHIAAKAVFFKETLSEEYKARQFKIIENAKRLSKSLVRLGFDILTEGTDNHMILVNVANFREGLTGCLAQKSLEDCGIVVNMNKLPYDDKPASISSGIRIGTPIVTRNGMGFEEMDEIAKLINLILRRVKIINSREYTTDKDFVTETRGKVKALCNRFSPD